MTEDCHASQTRRPLAGHVLFQTDQVDEARARVARKFCDHRLNATGARQQFNAIHHHIRGTAMSLNYMTYGAEVTIEPGHLETFYLVQMPIAGAARVANGGMQVDSHCGKGSILNPDRQTRMTWLAGCEQLLIQIDKMAIHALAEQIADRPIDVPIVFDAALDFAQAPLAQWRRSALALFAAADRQELFSPDARARHAAIELDFMAQLLSRQPANISEALSSVSGPASTSHVKRATAFIKSHAAEPINLADIAQAAGTSPRTLQLAFRGTFGMTPMQLLRHERLLRARLHLKTASIEAETISSIACQWGFYHFGRFASQYAQAFGELPHETRAGWRKGERFVEDAIAVN